MNSPSKQLDIIQSMKNQKLSLVELLENKLSLEIVEKVANQFNSG